MIRETLRVNNTTGLHARPASAIVKTISKHHAQVEFLFKEKVIKGKSVIALMTAGITGGATVEIICDGKDEVDVFLALKELFDAGFRGKIATTSFIKTSKGAFKNDSQNDIKSNFLFRKRCDKAYNRPGENQRAQKSAYRH